MPELLLELFSEEIPARMQGRGAEDLCRAAAAALAPVMEGAPRGFHGPRRIGLTAALRGSVTAEGREERGPRLGAPEAALAGFLRKHGAAREQLAERDGFWVLDRPGGTVTARDLIAAELPRLIRGFAWPKSMRWGEGGSLTWVRPLQRILCLLGGEVVRFDLRQAEDEAHGLASDNLTEGHRVMAPGAVAVHGFTQYEKTLRQRRVILDAGERMRIIEEGLAALASAEGLGVVPDRGLLEEVAGLVEWPVPLLGRIDAAFMDLPAEVMRTTMRVNQRYFALVTPDGGKAPRFGVVANIAASDGGAALVAGNERVLRARLSDARFFWDQDRRQPLEDFLPKLASVVFHAKLGTQEQRVLRLVRLAGHIAPPVGADRQLAERAALLCKADLASGMVGEFPELQGVMGRYYALAGGEDPRVAEAIGAHYRPLGPGDAVPDDPVAVTVALADKLDMLAGFFAAGEKPTGSGDPFALRRAGLGVIRIIREKGLRLALLDPVEAAVSAAHDAMSFAKRSSNEQAAAAFKQQTGGRTLHAHGVLRGTTARTIGGVLRTADVISFDLVDFLVERLRVQLRAEGARHDIVAAALFADDDLLRLLARAEALKALVESETGANLLAAYKRAGNILRIEEKKDGPHTGPVDAGLLAAPEERALAAALDAAEPAAEAALAAEDYAAAMSALAALRAPLDGFFDHVTVNAAENALRLNRLRLLNRLRSAMDTVADFSKIEG